MIPFKQYINGAWGDAYGGGTWDLVNPATEEILEQLPFGDETDAKLAIDAAAAAFPEWSHLTAYKRGAVLEKAALFIEGHLDAVPVVGRPSEYTPRSALLIAHALAESGLPAGVHNVVNGKPHEIGQAMLDDPRGRKIHFTGSARVGKLLMDGASRTVTRLSLELGGNAPVIVFPDAGDIAAVARSGLTAKVRNNGQVCVAPQRFYVHEAVAEEVSESAVGAARGPGGGGG